LKGSKSIFTAQLPQHEKQSSISTAWRVSALNRLIVLVELATWGVVAAWVIALITGPILQNSWLLPIDYVSGWFVVFAALLVNARVTTIAKQRGLFPYRVIANARIVNRNRDPRSSRARFSRRLWGEKSGED
jgi:hypothetical protein